jgi:hypothetical protein
MIGTLLCCARAASGHAAVPPTSVMKSRRLMGLPRAEGYAGLLKEYHI